MTDNNIYPVRLFDAVANRDAHAYWAIKRMAEQAGQTVEEWEAAHQDGMLTDEEVARYEFFKSTYDLMMRGAEPYLV